MRFELAMSHKHDPALAIDEMFTTFRASSADGSSPDFTTVDGRHDVMPPTFRLGAINRFGQIALNAALNAVDGAGRPGETHNITLLSSDPSFEEMVVEAIGSVVGPGATIMGNRAAPGNLMVCCAVFS